MTRERDVLPRVLALDQHRHDGYCAIPGLHGEREPGPSLDPRIPGHNDALTQQEPALGIDHTDRYFTRPFDDDVYHVSPHDGQSRSSI